MESVAIEVHQFEGFPLEWRLTKSDRRVIKAQDVCDALGWEAQTASRRVQKVFPEYRIKESFGQPGQPYWYLYEPGFFQLCFMAETEAAVKLQRFVFELLPKLFRGEVEISTSSQIA